MAARGCRLTGAKASGKGMLPVVEEPGVDHVGVGGQHRGGHLQQLPLVRAEPMKRARLVEQGQREDGDLAGVGLVPGVPAGEVQH